MMDSAVTILVVFYLAKILRIGTADGVFSSILDSLRGLTGGLDVARKPTRLQGAGGE